MKIFMIGGTGLLGSEAAKQLIERGDEVTSIALPPLPAGVKVVCNVGQAFAVRVIGEYL